MNTTTAVIAEQHRNQMIAEAAHRSTARTARRAERHTTRRQGRIAALVAHLATTTPAHRPATV